MGKRIASVFAALVLLMLSAAWILQRFSAPATEEASRESRLPAAQMFGDIRKASDAPGGPGAPDPADRVGYGRHIVQDMLNCYSCHSADFRSLDTVRPERSAGYLAGGNRLLDIDQNPIFSANITMDEETGIGTWSEEEFVRAMRTGVRPDGIPFRYPMARYPEMGKEAWKAVYAYLRSLPPVRNPVPRNYPDFSGEGITGEELYWKYACISCHGSSGKGLGDLTKVNADYPHDSTLVHRIRNPAHFSPLTRMPAFEGIIGKDEYAPLIDFLRGLSAAAGYAHK